MRTEQRAQTPRRLALIMVLMGFCDDGEQSVKIWYDAHVFLSIIFGESRMLARI